MTTPDAVGEAAGWRLVPVEPTKEMERAFYRACNEEGWSYWKSAYRALLAAAPAAPPAPEREGEDAELIAELTRLDKRGGLGYDAHDIIARAAARLAALGERVNALTDALKSARQQIWQYSNKADEADKRRLDLEADAIHPALAIDVQEHTQRSYQGGWDDGYAEGEGKWKARATAAEAERDAARAERDAFQAQRDDSDESLGRLISTCDRAQDERDMLRDRVESLQAREVLHAAALAQEPK